eukprot:1750858-Alexandrium_andersonii.AAC.1
MQCRQSESKCEGAPATLGLMILDSFVACAGTFYNQYGRSTGHVDHIATPRAMHICLVYVKTLTGIGEGMQ